MDCLVYKELDRWLQLVVDGSMFRCNSVTSSIPQRSILGPVLFDLFINGMMGSNAPSASFANNKMSGETDMQSRETILICGAM